VANTRSATSSRKPTARAATRQTAARAVAEPEGDFDEPDVTEVEAQESEAVNKYVTATLSGVDDGEEDVRIIPPGAWRQSWQRLLHLGQVDAFAKIALHPDDYGLYLDLDPTNEQFGDMVNEAAERAGESLGKSSGPAPSSRRTRRR
jgi:hypothetical protein